MFIRKELDRRGVSSLVQTQGVGLNGKVESTTYEITGPKPGQFSDLATARAWFDTAAAASELVKIEPA